MRVNQASVAPASGGSDDWAKDKQKIKYVFLMELRPREQSEWKCEDEDDEECS